MTKFYFGPEEVLSAKDTQADSVLSASIPFTVVDELDEAKGERDQLHRILDALAEQSKQQERLSEQERDQLIQTLRTQEHQLRRARREIQATQKRINQIQEKPIEKLTPEEVQALFQEAYLLPQLITETQQELAEFASSVHGESNLLLRELEDYQQRQAQIQAKIAQWYTFSRA
jgi:hypothetical protein